jgi:hypothetical protein
MNDIQDDIREIKAILFCLEKRSDFSPRWLSITRACIYAGIGEKTLMHYILSGDVYATKKGGKWIVDRESIDLFMLADDMQIKVALAKARGML